MSLLEDIRFQVHAHRERVANHLNALEAQLEATSDEAMQRLEGAAEALVESAEALEHQLKPKAEELRGDLQELRVQLALGRAESRDAYQAQRGKLLRQLDKAEANIDRVGHELAGTARAELERFVLGSEHLRAELEAAELQFALGRAEARDALAAGRAELREKIAKTREDLKDAGEVGADRLQAFEEHMGAAVDDIRRAFRALAGR
jgi:phage-related minor tail protein